MNSESNVATGDAPANAQPGFPVAAVRNDGGVKGIVSASKMWWVAVACLILAIALTWFAAPDTGTEITIRFPEGHGLQAGDSVRHRGIDIGQVTSVELNDDLTGVDVTVSLRAGADKLARADSRFWIVRPKLSLTAVEGLETAVGAKYIAVSPGDVNGQFSNDFKGLPSAPPNELEPDQTQVVLRGTKRHSLSPGSPLNWRGVEVGSVLSVHLSPDARYVDVIVGVDSEYQKLLRADSKFWVTSGVDLDVGMSGIKIDAESLATIARGGVSFISPTGSKAAPATPGQMFLLRDKLEESWLREADAANLVEGELPATVSIEATWKGKTFGIPRTRKRSFKAIVVITDGNLSVVVPRKAIEPPEKAENFQLNVSVPGLRKKVQWQLDSKAAKEIGPGILLAPLGDQPAPNTATQAGKLRNPKGPEECWAVQSVKGDGGASSTTQSIGRHEMRESDGVWILDLQHDMKAWHGAPVVSKTDHKVIGTVLVEDRGVIVAPFGSVATATR